MKNLIGNIGAYIVALLMVVSFYGAMLYTGVATRSSIMLIGVIAFALYISFSIKKKSVPMTIAGFAASTILFYGLWLFNSLIKYLRSFENPLVNKGFVILLSILIFLIIWRIYKFLSRIYIIVKPDEAHVVTRINGEQYVYSGDNSAEPYNGNHYWDFSKIPMLRMFLGMTVQKTRFDDLKIEVENLKVKSEDKAELTIGSSVFHLRVDPKKVLTVSKRWPGADMDIKIFKEKIIDIIEESVELTVIKFPIKALVGGNAEVNTEFRKILEKRLTDDYGVIITNAKLSQESGPAVDAIKKVKTEDLRATEEEATQNAEKRIQIATEEKQVETNKVLITTAKGLKEKKVIEAEAEKEVKIKEAEATAKETELKAIAEAKKIIAEGKAEAGILKKLLGIKTTNKEVHLREEELEAVKAMAESLKELHPALSTVIGSGGSGLAEIIATIKGALGIDLKKISE
jgi:regulator of protease activity HflC (stomatin/prohibitin superfamily)